MKLPSLCKVTKAEPITFPEKLSFPTLTHLCKGFGGKVFVMENHTSLLKALQVTEHVDCDEKYRKVAKHILS